MDVVFITRHTVAAKMCLKLMDTVFDDKRIVEAVLLVWLTVVPTTFEDLGLTNTQFMALGPSKATVFTGVVLDTWYKWGLVAESPKSSRAA